MILQSDVVISLVESFNAVVPQVRLTFQETREGLIIWLPASFDSLPPATKLLATSAFGEFMTAIQSLGIHYDLRVNRSA